MTVVLLPPALIAVGAALLFSVIAILDRMDMADDSQSRAKRKQWRKRFWQMLLFLLFLMYAPSLPLPCCVVRSLTHAIVCSYPAVSSKVLSIFVCREISTHLNHVFRSHVLASESFVRRRCVVPVE